MAEFLLYGKPQEGPLRYALGDIVEVYEDGRCTEVPDAPWYIVKVPGITKAQAMRFMEAHLPTPDATPDQMIDRRRFRVRVADVPAGIKDQLQSTRWVTVTPAKIVGYIRDKTTDTDITSF